MKKYLFALFCIMPCMTFAQVWKCIEFDNNLSKYNEIANKYKNSGNKKWSQMLLEVFPITNENTNAAKAQERGKSCHLLIPKSTLQLQKHRKKR